MIAITYGRIFEREYRKLVKKNPKLRAKIKRKVEFFVKNPGHKSLRVHKVYSPKVGEVFSFSANGDLRILFRWMSENRVIFYRIGSHKEVY
jgi:mRNA-degrading endonuclease YafQ of YafQ-DinJ toxin-antitoxin module